MKIIKMKKKALSMEMQQKLDQEFKNLDLFITNIENQIRTFKLNDMELLNGLTALQARYRTLYNEIKRDEAIDDQSVQQNIQKNVANQPNGKNSTYQTPVNPTGPQVGQPTTVQ